MVQARGGLIGVNAFLFVATVLIWGLTWIAMSFQVGSVPPLGSVLYRFVIASAIMFAILVATRRLSVPSRRDQPFIFAQAVCLYSCNFLSFYTAARYIPSGLESVIFSLSTVLNAIFARVFFGESVTGRTVLAGALGVAGVALIFAPDLMVGMNADVAKGVALSLVGVTFFSLGNMASRRNHLAGLKLETVNAWGMAYGVVILSLAMAATGAPLVAPPDARYVWALLYLAIFGSVIGFTTYLMLVARLGAAKAAYTTVLFPLVALAASTLYEGYRWTWPAALGVALTLIGNLVMFWRPRRGSG